MKREISILGLQVRVYDSSIRRPSLWVNAVLLLVMFWAFLFYLMLLGIPIPSLVPVFASWIVRHLPESWEVLALGVLIPFLGLMVALFPIVVLRLATFRSKEGQLRYEIVREVASMATATCLALVVCYFAGYAAVRATGQIRFHEVGRGGGGLGVPHIAVEPNWDGPRLLRVFHPMGVIEGRLAGKRLLEK